MRRSLRWVLRILGVAVLALAAVVGWVAWQVHDAFRPDDAAAAALAARLDAHRTAVPGTTVDLALDGCDLYRATHDTSAWTAVDLPYPSGDYPRFMTGCTRADLRITADGAVVSTCAQAIGAGGGCARAGTFRSRDGTTWERAGRAS